MESCSSALSRQTAFFSLSVLILLSLFPFSSSICLKTSKQHSAVEREQKELLLHKMKTTEETADWLVARQTGMDGIIISVMEKLSDGEYTF